MTQDLRKRLEEAAEEYAERQDYMELENEFLVDDEGICITRIYRGKQVEDSFLAGAEWDYKEAIAQAKEWMTKYFPDELDGKNFEFVSRDEVLTDFETDMNKLWEGEK